MQHFDYHKAVNLEEACEALTDSKGPAVLLAGGTDLMLKLKEGKLRPARVIDLKGIQGMDRVSVSENELSIGALVTMRTLETSAPVLTKAPLLAQAAAQVGSVQVRYRATLGGNLCNAAPSTETAPALLALDAKAEIHGKSGTRIVELVDFFLGPGATILKEDEVLTALKIPLNENQQGAVYYKLSARKAMDIAFVGVAVLLEVDRKGSILKARIALGAVAPTPIRAVAAEMVLEGKRLDAALAEESSRLAAQACRPISDIRASAEYRRQMTSQLCRRGLFAAYHQVTSQKQGDRI